MYKSISKMFYSSFRDLIAQLFAARKSLPVDFVGYAMSNIIFLI